MFSAMNILSSFTIFALFVSFVSSKSLEFSDKNFIDSLNFKNILTPVILNDDENNHILKKRQDNYNNEDGMQVNGDIEGSNSTFNQIQHGIQESHTILKEKLLIFQQKYRQTFQYIQIQISNLATEFDYLEKKIESRKLRQSTTPCPPIPKCPSTTPILVTSPTTTVTIKPSTKSTTWFTSTRPTTTQSTTTTTTTYTTSTKPTTKISSTSKLTTISSTKSTTKMSPTTQSITITSAITVTVTTPTTQVVTQTPKAPCQQTTTNSSNLPETTTKCICNG